ncbi:hypothetical protein EDB19DRAFT_1706776 [Suillus lakei]|nr:hypothetical protein EDB19DRAFT_1706776 [Suillus lakei]
MFLLLFPSSICFFSFTGTRQALNSFTLMLHLSLARIFIPSIPPRCSDFLRFIFSSAGTRQTTILVFIPGSSNLWHVCFILYDLFFPFTVTSTSTRQTLDSFTFIVNLSLAYISFSSPHGGLRSNLFSPLLVRMDSLDFIIYGLLL